MRKDKVTARNKRKKRIRKSIFGVAENPRVSVFRSNMHIYAQIIDDENGKTLVSASSNDKDIRNLIKDNSDLKGKKDIAFLVGEELGKKAKENNIEAVLFDRNGYLYHGRVKALADGLRKAGLKF